MSDLAIRATHLTKQYTIGEKRRHFDSIGELLVHKLSRLFNPSSSTKKRETTTFNALDNVSFEVKKGQAVAIIGKNGSGKSTLLKIMSRVTMPTRGRAEVYGRIGSLLEVGTGFHPELTGRENVYLNGAILGMKKREIDGKFDEIVAFSEVEKFIDTPVKRYSSGMYTKLAFAVAAHLESEILMVDEVLAVGDFSFQRKCLGKMDDVTRQGRTILFVSHSLSSVQNLCTEGLVLNEGTAMFYGKIGEAIEKYIGSVTRHEYGFAELVSHPGRYAGMRPIIQSVGILSNGGMVRYRDMVTTGEDVVLEIHFDSGEDNLDYATVGIDSAAGERVCTVGTHLCSDIHLSLRGKGVLECRIPRLLLVEGEYTLSVGIGRAMPRQCLDFVESAVTFRVDLGNYYRTGHSTKNGQGHLAQLSEWCLVS
jgi:lipopolysaccharide transport system ATP-binding protein